MGKILPILLALIGTGAGVGAGLFLMPPPEEATEEHAAIDCLPPEGGVDAEMPPDQDFPIDTREYVKLNNQFIIPIVSDTRVKALVVAALSVEVAAGGAEVVYAREPKLRDVFLQVFLDHANIGGFDGNFTEASQMNILRGALMDVARQVLGNEVSDVLITEIAKQDN